MNSIRIGSDQRSLSDVEESWIVQQIRNRQREGLPICVQVTLQTSSLNLKLSTPGCGGGGGSRPPTPEEDQIFQLWEKHKLQTEGFSGGEVVAFIKQLRRHL